MSSEVPPDRRVCATTITVGPLKRGVHLVTRQIEAAIKDLTKGNKLAAQPGAVGLCNLFIQHTSASLTITENCDPDVRLDLEDAMNRVAPEDETDTLYRHSDEGPDDMPAHIKNTMVGASLNIPWSADGGGLNLGTWQGVAVWEHRDRASKRRIVVTLML